MPELPEVETIKRGLAKKIIGLKIAKVEILNPKSFEGEVSELKGAKITGVWRKGKVLGITLLTATRSPQTANTNKSGKQSAVSSQRILLFHLKMSGQIILVSGGKQTAVSSKPFAGGHPTKDMLGEMPNKSTRVIFTLAVSGKQSAVSRLYFNDQRKFGWIKLANSDQLSANSFLNNLGPEPLDKAFTWQILKQNLLRHQNLPVKVALLDQTAIAGIGNIYACEACFNSKLNPQMPVYRLQTTDYRKLHQGIIDALTLSIQKGGSSKQHFFNEDGQKGHFLDFTYVYDRAKLPCKVCQTPIKKITLAGRGTYFCPNCQR